MQALSTAFLVLAATGVVYYVLSTWALVAHFRRASTAVSPAHAVPSISVLKPVAGADAESVENFASFVTQGYPDYEVIFGVLGDSDPALHAIRSVIGDAPKASLHIGTDIEGANNKVRILHALARRARGELLVITDADTRVAPDFLARVAAPFADDSVGAVTCLYKGIAARTLADRLTALHMSCVFAPGVACAERLGGIHFGLGAAVAVRSDTLEQIGGFEQIAGFLADDFQLGRRAARTGRRVVLSDYVVDVVRGGEGLREALSREVRWALAIRVSRPWGYLGLLLTFGFAWAALFCLVSGFVLLGWSILLGTGAVRIASAWAGARIGMRDVAVVRSLYLLPVRDLLSFAVWVVSHFTRTVIWRGRRLRLGKGGRIKAVREW